MALYCSTTLMYLQANIWLFNVYSTLTATSNFTDFKQNTESIYCIKYDALSNNPEICQMMKMKICFPLILQHQNAAHNPIEWYGT